LSLRDKPLIYYVDLKFFVHLTQRGSPRKSGSPLIAQSLHSHPALSSRNVLVHFQIRVYLCTSEVRVCLFDCLAQEPYFTLET
jgi:hypothetical protein